MGGSPNSHSQDILDIRVVETLSENMSRGKLKIIQKEGYQYILLHYTARHFCQNQWKSDGKVIKKDKIIGKQLLLKQSRIYLDPSISCSSTQLDIFVKINEKVMKKWSKTTKSLENDYF